MAILKLSYSLSPFKPKAYSSLINEFRKRTHFTATGLWFHTLLKHSKVDLGLKY